MIEIRDGFAHLSARTKLTLAVASVAGGLLILALALHVRQVGERRGSTSIWAPREQDPSLAAGDGDFTSADPTLEPGTAGRTGGVAEKSGAVRSDSGSGICDLGSGLHRWPAKPVVLGPPSARTGQDPAKIEALAQPAPTNVENPLPIILGEVPTLPPTEGPRPSPAEIQEVASWPVPNDETLRKIRDLLLDPARSSTLKLIALEKLRAFLPEQSTPVLAEFLESAQPAGAAYTKPTAVKVLVDCGHETSNAALAKLARSTDERVRIAVSCWRARP